MTGVIKVNKLEGRSTAGSIIVPSEGNTATINLQQGLIKHWCNWNQSGTISIYDSFNNSSITDVQAGYTTIGFSNNFANVNYVYTGGANQAGYSSPIFGMQYRSNKTTSQTQVRTLATANSNAVVDPDDVGMHTNGDLA